MADAKKNLELRGRTWWANTSVPPSLRPIVGKRMLRHNLKTRDIAEAQRLRPHALALMNEELERARKQVHHHPDPIIDRALTFRHTPALRIGADGSRTPDDAFKASLMAQEAAEIARRHGAEVAERFKQIATAKTFTPIDAHLADFQAENGVLPKTKIEQRTAVRRLMEWDTRLSLEMVDRKTAGDYILKGLTFTESPATKNKQITCLSSYWRWMMQRGRMDSNPWREQHVSTKKKSTDRKPDPTERPFTDQEILALFAGVGPAYLHDAMRLAALSGMRLEELCMLRVADCTDGVFAIRSAKTDAGVRNVPIHSALTGIVASRCRGKRPDEFLLHELGPEPPPGSARGRGSAFSQYFTRYREKLGVDDSIKGKRRSLINWHSWRRWFVTQAEQAGQPPWMIESVVGHARTGMTLGVYSKGPSIEQLRQVIESVQLPTSANA